MKNTNKIIKLDELTENNIYTDSIFADFEIGNIYTNEKNQIVVRTISNSYQKALEINQFFLTGENLFNDKAGQLTNIFFNQFFNTVFTYTNKFFGINSKEIKLLS